MIPWNTVANAPKSNAKEEAAKIETLYPKPTVPDYTGMSQKQMAAAREEYRRKAKLYEDTALRNQREWAYKILKANPNWHDRRVQELQNAEQILHGLSSK